MRCVRGFVAFLALATVGWLAFVPATTVATNPAPEHLITGFSDAPNPDAIFYAINKASAADSAPLRKAALAYIGDNDQKTRYAALYALALPPWDHVSAILLKAGVAPQDWPAAYKEALRVPQHLTLFLRHFARSERQVFETVECVVMNEDGDWPLHKMHAGGVLELQTEQRKLGLRRLDEARYGVAPLARAGRGLKRHRH